MTSGQSKFGTIKQQVPDYQEESKAISAVQPMPEDQSKAAPIPDYILPKETAVAKVHIGDYMMESSTPAKRGGIADYMAESKMPSKMALKTPKAMSKAPKSPNMSYTQSLPGGGKPALTIPKLITRADKTTVAADDKTQLQSKVISRSLVSMRETRKIIGRSVVVAHELGRKRKRCFCCTCVIIVGAIALVTAVSLPIFFTRR